MEHGLRRLREDNFPLSLRLIREMHQVLMQGGRGAHRAPGEFRSSQNWIGGSCPADAAFVPAPPDQLADLLDGFKRFLHAAEEGLPN